MRALAPPSSSKLESWGRYPKVRQQARALHWADDRLPLPDEGFVLPYGMGRSYGDACLNDGGTLLVTTHLDRFLAFDRAHGVLRCEAGVTLAAVLDLVVPHGWFLPVTPGTKHVTVGGAVANDVHGKNHHVRGCFGNHVRAFEVLRSDGTRLLCTPTDNADLFAATIGGLGLTGLMTWVEFALLPTPTAYIETENVKVDDIDEFLAVTRDSQRFEYTVAWIDSLRTGRALGRGVFFRGNHAAASSASTAHRPAAPERLRIPIDFPSLTMNKLSIGAFNRAYGALQRMQMGRTKIVHWDPFFYPLDVLGEWNRVYGTRGFLQYQCVVPITDDNRALRDILDRVARTTAGSFVTVLKVFGDVRSPGLMSFPRPGITVTFDLPMTGAPLLAVCDALDQMVLDAGGAVYPAKDARMSPSTFRACFPQWESFARHIDPRFSSSFWRRVTA